ncbi:SPAG17 [Bugula neritina]|uniref:SPAG17 n=1 Tax=Bugula neritina TaxID=10212 RepID=A0A7J7KRC5_BUGNE|nr:SPAG17 [Bugula neritina]
MFNNETPESQVLKQPTLYNKNDDISFRTDHLSTVYGFNAKEAELAMLEKLPIIGALEPPDVSEKQSMERAAKLQQLLHFCVNEDLSPSELKLQCPCICSCVSYPFINFLCVFEQMLTASSSSLCWNVWT